MTYWSKQEMLEYISEENANGRFPNLTGAITLGHQKPPARTRQYRGEVVNRLISMGVLINRKGPGQMYALEVAQPNLDTL